MKKLEYKSGTSNKKTRSAIQSNSIKNNGKAVENSKSKVKNKNYKKNVKSKKRKIIILSFVILGLLISFIYLIFTLEAFGIASVEIIGNSKYTQEEIKQNLEINIGSNIFKEVLKNNNKEINKLPYIEKVKMHIKLPDILQIEVVEREALYFSFDKEKNKYYRIDKYGYLLEEADISQKIESELLTYGFIFDDEIYFGSKLKDIDMSKIAIYQNIYNEFIKSGISGKITKLSFENSLTTITINDKLNVILPNDTNIKYNMKILKQIIEKIGEDSAGVVDMTKSNPIFSNF